MKKVVLFSVVLVCVVLLLASCQINSTPTSPQHSHSYTDSIVPSTCTEVGYRFYQCDCGNSYEETIPALGHDVQHYEAKDPTCTDIGWNEHDACTRCDYKIDYIEELALGHDYDAHRSCTRCNFVDVSEGLAYELSNGTYSVCGIGTCKDSVIVIPAEYNGLPVTNIEYEAFKACSQMNSVIIPDSVVSIEMNAFYDCSNLSYIVIPDSVISIGVSAFFGCDKLLQMEDGVYYVNQWAVNCQRDCVSVILRSDTIGIADNAFSNCYSMTSVIISENVKVIGNEAFSLCTQLASINIPDSVIYMGYYVFSNCSFLASVTIGNNVQSIGINAFENCVRLHSVSIGASVNSIEKGAFLNCQSLASFTINHTIKSIGAGAFNRCANLQSVNIGSGLESIADDAFLECNNLKAFSVDNNNGYFHSIDGNLYTKNGTKLLKYATGKKEVVFTIPDGVTSIGDFAFQNNYYLASVTIPNSVSHIGVGAFSNCSKIFEVINHSKLSIVKGSENYGAIALRAFYVHNGESKIKNVDDFWFFTAPDGTHYLVGYTGTSVELILPSNYNGQSYQLYQFAFAYETKIKSVIIPYGVDIINDNAFYLCKNLLSVSLPNSLTSIGACAFDGCYNLASIVIPDSVTTIGKSAFFNCYALSSVTIGSGVALIGKSAFYNCSKLTVVIFKNTNGWSAGKVVLLSDNLAETDTAAYFLTNKYLSEEWKLS